MTEKIILRLTRGMNISQEEMEIISYGLYSILSKGSGLLLPMPIVLFLGLWREYILFYILFSILRPQSGGYHADTKVHCVIISFILSLMAVIGVKLWEPYYLDKGLWFFALILLLEIAIGMIAPVDVVNKRLTKEEKKYYRKKVIILLLIMNLILAACVYLKIMFYAYVMVQVLLCQILLLIGGGIKNSMTRHK